MKETGMSSDPQDMPEDPKGSRKIPKYLEETMEIEQELDGRGTTLQSLDHVIGTVCRVLSAFIA